MLWISPRNRVTDAEGRDATVGHVRRPTLVSRRERPAGMLMWRGGVGSGEPGLWHSSGFSCRDRQSEIERCSFARLRLDPDPATISVDHALADSQADTRPWNVAAVQPLEHAEDRLMVLCIDTHAIIGHGEPPLAILPFRRNLNTGRRRAPLLDCIANKILEELNEMRWLTHDHGKRIA